MLPSTHLSLIEAARAADPAEPGAYQDAWRVFVLRYQEPIRDWYRGRGVDESTADDLTQEILTRLCQALPTYDAQKARFRTWLGAIIRNVLTDHFRRLQRRPDARGQGGSDALEVLNRVQDPDAVEDLAAAVEGYEDPMLREALAQVRGRVQEHSWLAFHLSWIEARPTSEVAARCGLTVGAVHQTRFRLLRMVGEEYRRRLDSSAPGLSTEEGA